MTASCAAQAERPALHSTKRIELILLWVVLTACIVRFWILPLTSSLWIDEMVTVFVVQHGSGDASLAVAPQVRDSAYYALPKLSQKIFGPSELAYRIPSVLVMLAAMWLIALLASRIIHPRAGWFTVFACLALPGINFQADDARPYAFGTCIAAAGAYCLVRWLDTARWRDAALFVLCAALLWRIHLIFWPFYIVLALYAAVRLAAGETNVSWGRVAAVFGAVAVALLPVLWDAVNLFRNAGAHVIVPLPNIRELKRSLQLNLPLFCGGIALLLGLAFRWRRPGKRTSWGSLALILGWWLVPPLALFGFSYLTGDSVFIARYLYIGLAGAALTAAWVSSMVIPDERWRQLSIVLGVVVLAMFGHWRIASPPHNKSGWRMAAAQIDALQLSPGTPVICPSPFIEARPPVWRPDYRLPGFLYAHLPVYAIAGHPYLFPFEPSPQAKAYAAELSQTVLPKSDRFLIYGGDRNVLFWRDWFSSQPELADWNPRRLGPFGDVDVVVFQKTNADLRAAH